MDAARYPGSFYCPAAASDAFCPRRLRCYSDLRRRMSDRIYASYWIETAFPLQQAAEIMAGEQSTGTFVRVPGETDELRERHAARVESIRECGAADSPSLPGAGLPKGLAGAPGVAPAPARRCSSPHAPRGAC